MIETLDYKQRGIHTLDRLSEDMDDCLPCELVIWYRFRGGECGPLHTKFQMIPFTLGLSGLIAIVSCGVYCVCAVSH